MTTEAWKLFNGKIYKEAILKAETCIDDFAPTAKREHRELQDSNEPKPPLGKVKNKKEKDRILQRGLINDVATCWFIKGRSLEKLGKRKDAANAYCEAAKYPYARTYDPSWDGFWSPAQSATDRAKNLGRRCE